MVIQPLCHLRTSAQGRTATQFDIYNSLEFHFMLAADIYTRLTAQTFPCTEYRKQQFICVLLAWPCRASGKHFRSVPKWSLNPFFSPSSLWTAILSKALEGSYRYARQPAAKCSFLTTWWLCLISKTNWGRLKRRGRTNSEVRPKMSFPVGWIWFGFEVNLVTKNIIKHV